MSANAIQVGGEHYKDQTIEPWDFSAKFSLSFFDGNIIKYVTRWRTKGGVQDLEKVEHYIMKLEELAEDGFEASGKAGSRAINEYLTVNEISDFREKILISIFAGGWTVSSLNHAALLVVSLIESARGEAEK